MTENPTTPVELGSPGVDSVTPSPISPNSDKAPLAPPNVPPKLPPRSNSASTKDSGDSVGKKLALRQNELYAWNSMNMHADILANTPIQLKERIEKLSSSEEFWARLLENYGPQYITDKIVEEIEQAVIAGVPSEVRPLLYLKIMQIRAHMDSTMYNGIFKKAKLAQWETTQPETEAYSEGLKEIMQVFQYCISEIAVPNTPDSSHRALKIVERVAHFLVELPELSNPEVLAILFKVDALFNNLSKEEFCYKASRSLEDNTPKTFLHIVKQGIDLSSLFRNFLLSVIGPDMDEDFSIRVLDFVVFEGFDFLHRILTAVFEQKEKQILDLNGNELYSYIYSNEFLSDLHLATLEAALKIAPSFVKYENEYHLMSVNAISGNDSELTNLKETNEDLSLHLKDLKSKTESLSKTEAEIVTQLTEYTEKLKEAQEEKERLSKEEDELRAKYAQLTMNENLTNLVNANKDISNENAELEAQIAELEKQIATKSAKLKKVQK
ncbi:putative GTPase-activating protein [Clavispora lusitaniae]|uniref:GTPase-activating protein n=1 Tax=Clavispora lusitaniae TaxID=36911 RepID=A0AA91T183_CLALS|nr:putative GTPase-activating protein [Clavispora lusitaniae]